VDTRSLIYPKGWMVWVAWRMFHIQPEDGHYQAPKHVVVLYVINNIYPPDSCVRQ